ncbi:uncharacterized protein [Parasteatoda tepidariorum]|uniref:uncharacterized protein n=1 Tax=Parasteatoda tepidariorum TaxID=114398 RepID=UPI00077FA466|nr:uncharacterized protein LOC107447627 [Parasteatoda tepidariorum]
MDLEDNEISEEDFLRMHDRQWNNASNYRNASEIMNPILTVENPYKKRREDAAHLNFKPLELNLHCGKTQKSKFSFPQCLSYRENGMTSQSNFNSQILKLKMRQLKWVSMSQIDFSDYVNCYYVTGFKRNIIGAWTYHEYSATLLESVSFQYKKLDSKSNNVETSISQVSYTHIATLPSYKVFDMCGLTSGNQDYVLYVANSYSRHKNMAYLARAGVNNGGEAPRDDIVRRFEHQDILWSCSWNDNKKRFAIGADRCFYLHDYQSFSKKIELSKGQPYSLDFNSDGNILYCGLHQGDLVCYDLRTEAVPAMTIPLCTNISYIKLMSHERNVVASGFNSVLLNVDLRAKKEVFQYPHHYSLYKKLTFSFNESANILCAPGEDNITRLWSLSDGELLHSLPLPNAQDYCGQINSLFEADDRRIFVHILLGDTIHTFESLEDCKNIQPVALSARLRS